MKKFLLSAGALLLAFGLGLSYVGVRMGGETRATVRLFGRSWDVYAPTSGWNVVSTTVRDVAEATPMPPVDRAMEQADHVTSTDMDSTRFSSLDINLDLGSVTIAAADDYGVVIDTWGAGYQVDHWYSGDTLTIESKGSSTHLPDCGCSVTVYVPAGVWLENLYVDLDLGDLTLAGIQAEYADIDLDLGSLTGEALTVKTTLDVEANLGEVNLYGDLGEYVDISADLGSVQLGLSKPASDYCWELEADMGSITVDGKNQHTNDDGKVTGGSGNRTIEVDASLGSITLDFDQDFAGPSVERPSVEPPSVESPPSVEALQEQTATVTEDKGTADRKSVV